MKKKRSKGSPILIVILLIIIASVIIFSNLNLGIGKTKMLSTYYDTSSGGALSLISSGSGDEYYEERCIDTTDYLNDGYSFDKLDEDGCDIVKKMIIGSQTTVYCGSGGYWSGGVIRAANDRCERELGKNWMWCSAYGTEPTGRVYHKYLCCGLPYPNYKGGMEKVLNTCSYDQNDMLVAETFSGGQTINKDNLRYPIKSFCRAHPSIITQDSTKTSFTSTNIPQDLINEVSVTISSDETLTIFYIIENNYDLPTICTSDDNLALNVGTGVCSSTLGFTYLCSEGVFDALSGVCIVQPESKEVCEKGRYDIALGVCIYNPPINVDCGSNNCYYSLEQDTCVCSMTDQLSCDEGYTIYYPTQSNCEGEGDVWLTCPQCPSDKICPSSICKPRCDQGVTCKNDNNYLIEYCLSNGEITGETGKGQCSIYGEWSETNEEGKCPTGYSKVTMDKCREDIEEFNLCNNDETFNYVTLTCDKPAILNAVCPETSTPRFNNIKSIIECVVEPTKYVECENGYLYNKDLDMCVKDIQVYEPSRDDILIYTEIDTGCEDTSECTIYGSTMICNTEYGICHTDTSQATALLIIKQELYDYYNIEYSLLEEDYINRVNELLGDIASKIAYINSLNATVQELSVIIDNYELTLTEMDLLVEQLNLEVSEREELLNILSEKVIEQEEQIGELQSYIDVQAEIILNSTLLVSEQATQIIELDLTLDEQAELINRLTTNLEDKAYFISLLVVENEEQARLISLMEESFTNQGVILGNLRLEIEDDAIIIGELSDTNEELAQIMQGMGVTIQELKDYSTALELTNKDMGELLTVMNYTISELRNSLNLLATNNEDMIEIISNLKIKNEELKELATQLTSTLEERDQLLSDVTAYQEKVARTRLLNKLLIGLVAVLFIIILAVTRKKKKGKKKKNRGKNIKIK